MPMNIVQCTFVQNWYKILWTNENVITEKLNSAKEIPIHKEKIGSNMSFFTCPFLSNSAFPGWNHHMSYELIQILAIKSPKGLVSIDYDVFFCELWSKKGSIK